jgi:hypothetical protein
VLSTGGGRGNGTHPTALNAPTSARSAAPVPTQGVAAGSAGTPDQVPLPKRALDSELQAVGLAARQASAVADAAKAAALQARANVCKGHQKDCPKPRAGTTTTP